MKTTTHGTRYKFTRQTRVHAEPDDDVDVLADYLTEPTWLQHVERVCRDVLVDHGLPDDPDRDVKIRADEHGRIAWTRDGTVAEWQDAEPDRELRGWIYVPPRFLADELHVDVDSALGYAVQILDHVLQARQHAAAGRVEAGLGHAFAAGACCRESAIADHVREKHKPGADSTNAPYQQSRELCVETARELWANDYDRELRIGDVVRFCRDELRRRGMTEPADKTIRRYLHNAGLVPDYATTSGRDPS